MGPRPTAETAGAKRRPYRRQQILSAAVRRFHDQGYHATTMKEIAADVGVTAGAIYQHFPNKQAILDAAVESATAELHERVERAAESVESPRPLLNALVAELVDAVVTDIPLAAVSRHDRALAGDAARAAAERSERLVVAELVSALRRVRPELPANEVRTMVHGAVGIAYSVTHTESGMVAEDAATSLRRAMTSALLAPIAR